MYKLYFLPGACSLATLTILNELDQSVELIHKQDARNYLSLNPVDTVPVLVDQDKILNEGVAIILHLLNKHKNNLIDSDGAKRHRSIENILFANATMHPAYGRLFFIAQNLDEGEVKQQAFIAATAHIKSLWDVVEEKLKTKSFLGGDKISPADIMLTVYSRWGEHFSVDILIGQKTKKMIQLVKDSSSFQLALDLENSYMKKSK